MKLAISIGYSGGRVELPVDFVLEAERLGYDSVWTAEAYGSDAVTPLAYLAAKTTRIKLGTSIMQLAGRTPAMCAMTMSTLDALSGGRVLVGPGLSGPQVVEGWHGVPYDKPVARLREYVQILRKIWARGRRISITRWSRATATAILPPAFRICIYPAAKPKPLRRYRMNSAMKCRCADQRRGFGNATGPGKTRG